MSLSSFLVVHAQSLKSEPLLFHKSLYMDLMGHRSTSCLHCPPIAAAGGALLGGARHLAKWRLERSAPVAGGAGRPSGPSAASGHVDDQPDGIDPMLSSSGSNKRHSDETVTRGSSGVTHANDGGQSDLESGSGLGSTFRSGYAVRSSDRKASSSSGLGDNVNLGYYRYQTASEDASEAIGDDPGVSERNSDGTRISEWPRVRSASATSHQQEGTIIGRPEEFDGEVSRPILERGDIDDALKTFGSSLKESPEAPSSWPFDVDTEGADVLHLSLWGQPWATAVREPLLGPSTRRDSTNGGGPAGAAATTGGGTLGGGDGGGVLSASWAAVRAAVTGREPDWEQRGGRRIKVVVKGEVMAGLRNDAVLDGKGE